MIHGGFRYISEGQLAVSRESCRERDLLLRKNPNLVRNLSFLLPSYEGGKVAMWQVRAGLFVYAALANFRASVRSRILGRDEVTQRSPDLRSDGLLGAGLYNDGQVDDVRLVVESLKSARTLGAEAVNGTEVFEFGRSAQGRVSNARLRDLATRREYTVSAHAIVNAAGPSVERVRGMDQKDLVSEMRPAKGVHLVIPRDRVRSEHAVIFAASDGRLVFFSPWEEVALLGTTDDFTDEIDDPVVYSDEADYLLAAANSAFPRAELTRADLLAVYAGVRPLVAPLGDESPSTKVSREHRIYQEASGLISVAGGKLTTYRAMGEAIVDRAVALLPQELRSRLGASRTRALPLRDEDFDIAELERTLCRRFEIEPFRAAYLVRAYGLSAQTLLQEATPELREPIGRSRYSYAEIPWSWRNESPSGLCDLLERRLRLPIFGESQGLTQLARIAEVVAQAAGWDDARRDREAAAYAEVVRRCYQVVPTDESADHSKLPAAAA
jgi:glycerol-3-phosphate dehydrogenase